MESKNMADNGIVRTIRDAEIDARSLSEFISKGASFEVSRRLAPTVHTLDYYLSKFDSLHSGYAESLNRAEAASFAAISNAEGLVDNVVNQAIDQVNTAIDGIAIDANLVTDALVTTAIRNTGQVVRTQAQKNAEFLSVKDFGAVGDGVTDDYPAIAAAIKAAETYSKGNDINAQTVYFPAGDYYCSQTINIQSVIKLVGESSSLSATPTTKITFAPNIDGIIVNNRRSYGADETITDGTKGDGCMIIGLWLEQKGYVAKSQPVYDYNPDTQQVLTYWIWDLDVGAEVVAQDDRRNEHFSATVSSINKGDKYVLITNKSLYSYPLGTTVTGLTSGAVGKIGYKSKNKNAVVITDRTGLFRTGEDIMVAGVEYKLVEAFVYSKGYNIYTLSNTQGELSTGDILQPKGEYGTGITLRARATIKDCQVYRFPHNGIASVSGNDTPDNANSSNFIAVAAKYIGRHGLFSVGADSNAINIFGLNMYHCVGWAVKDNSFLGNHYFGCNAGVGGLGIYYSGDHQNHTLFSGCYSEGVSYNPYPFYNVTSRFGKKTTIVGGDHGARTGASFIGDRGTEIWGDTLTFGKGLYATGGSYDVSNQLKSLTVNGTGVDGSVLELRTTGTPLAGKGAGLAFMTPKTSNTQFSYNNDEQRRVGSITIADSTSRMLGGELILKLTPELGAVSSISIDGTVSDKAQLYPIIEGGEIKEIQVLHGGSGHAESMPIRATGVFSGLVATANSHNGVVQNVEITTNVSGLPTQNPVDTLSITGSAIRTYAGKSMSLGEPFRRFSELNAEKPTTTISDANLVTEVSAIDANAIDAWAAVSHKAYKYLSSVNSQGSSKSNIYLAPLAQDIVSAFSDKGLDATKYGLVRKTTSSGVDEWSIRGEQCLFLEAAYQRSKISSLEARVEALEG